MIPQPNILTTSEHQTLVLKLKHLYLKDKTLFNTVASYVPFGISVSHKKTFNISYANAHFVGKSEALLQLVKQGGRYLKTITCPYLYQVAVQKIQHFTKTKDTHTICTLLHHIRYNNEQFYTIVLKLHLDNEHYFNLCLFEDDLPGFSSLLKQMLRPFENQPERWAILSTLTPRERQIIALLAEGLTKKDIGEVLCISPHSVHTHRRNIYKKLSIRKVSELIHIHLVITLLDP